MIPALQDGTDSWYAIVETKGWRLAWIACTDGTNHEYNNRAPNYGLVLSCFDPTVVDIIRTLAKQSDVHSVVAVVHWGGSCAKEFSPDQCGAAKAQGYDIGKHRGAAYQRQPDCSQKHFAHSLAGACPPPPGVSFLMDDPQPHHPYT